MTLESKCGVFDDESKCGERLFLTLESKCGVNTE